MEPEYDQFIIINTNKSKEYFMTFYDLNELNDTLDTKHGHQ